MGLETVFVYLLTINHTGLETVLSTSQLSITRALRLPCLLYSLVSPSRIMRKQNIQIMRIKNEIVRKLCASIFTSCAIFLLCTFNTHYLQVTIVINNVECAVSARLSTALISMVIN